MDFSAFFMNIRCGMGSFSASAVLVFFTAGGIRVEPQGALVPIKRMIL